MTPVFQHGSGHSDNMAKILDVKIPLFLCNTQFHCTMSTRTPKLTEQLLKVQTCVCESLSHSIFNTHVYSTLQCHKFLFPFLKSYHLFILFLILFHSRMSVAKKDGNTVFLYFTLVTLYIVKIVF